MGIIDSIKDALIPQTEKGVRHRCTNCDARFDESYQECPECGSTEIKEEEGFELRPQT